MSCTTTNLYDSLEYCKGQTVVPGLYDEVYYLSKSQIVTFPELPAIDGESLTMEAIGTLSGNFTLAADAHFLKIACLDTASNITSASQGEAPSKTFLNSSTIKYPGNHAAAVGFCRLANADDLVYVVRQRTGEYRVLGNKMFRTNTNPSQDSGMAVTDASGTTLEISVTDLAPAPIYTGTLPIEGGTLNCATGVVTASSPSS